LFVVFISIRNSDEGASILKWQAIFLVLCGIGVLCVDPLFLYLPVINQDDKCLTLDRKLMITALCLRSVSDMIYVGNIILGYYNRRHGRTGSNPSKPREIVEMYLRTYIAIDILALLPIPQVIN
jgi:cyclic nucleotide gated channel